MDGEKEPEEKHAIQLTNFVQPKDESAASLAATEKKRRVSLATASRLRIGVLVVSWFSVTLLGSLGVTTFVISVLDHSSSSFAFALTAILDCLSSLVVIWRYASPSALYSSAKERARDIVACIALAIVFLLSGVSVIIRSALALSEDDRPKKADIIWYLAIVNSVVCLAFFLAKLFLAYKLESMSVATDSINSLIGFTLALATLVGDLVYQQNHSVWYVDPVLGIVCSTFLFIYGSWLLVYELRQAKEEKGYEQMD